MLSIALIQTGNYLNRGAEYVTKLRQGLARNFTRKCRVYVITDDVASNYPGAHVKPSVLPGWWEKIRLFRPGMFPEGRVLFLDLDTLIVGNIDFLADYQGEFATLRDFWRPDRGLGPAVMAWRAGYGEDIWQSFVDAGKPMEGNGDQTWLERYFSRRGEPDFLQDLYPGAFVSYKEHCSTGRQWRAGAEQRLPPDGARVVCFHGLPRPHECNGWVRGAWNG